MNSPHDAVVTWHVDATLNHPAQSVWGRDVTATLHKKSGESRDHVVLKLLGLLLTSAHPSAHVVKVEPPHRVVDFKPDVAAFNAAGDVVEWIECGDVAVAKLDKLTRALGAAVIVHVLKKGERPARLLAAELKTLARPDRVVVWGFEAPAIDAIGELLGQRSRSAVVATINEEQGGMHIEVAVNDDVVTVRAVKAAAA